MIETYNEQMFKWERQANRDANVDDFVVYDDRKIKWSRDLKLDLKRGKIAEYSEHKLRNSLYRPFTKSNLFFDRIMNEEVYNFPSIFPTPETEARKSSDLCERATEVKEPLQTLMVANLFLILNFYATTATILSLSTPMTKTAQTAAKTSPIGRWHNSEGTTKTRQSPNATSSTTSTPS